MTIKVGDRLPDAKFMMMGANGPQPATTDEIFKGKKIALFAVPGAFTPTCSEQHLPGFIANADKLKKKGADAIVCTAVNDIFVLQAWSKARGADEAIRMISDGNAEFARKLGLDVDLSGFGLGTRTQRYVMFVDDGVVKYLAVEDAPPMHDKATAEKLLAAL